MSAASDRLSSIRSPIAGSKLLTELADLVSQIATEIPRITNADATRGRRGSIAVSGIEVAAKEVIDVVTKKAIDTATKAFEGWKQCQRYAATKAFESWKQCQHMWAAPGNLETLQRRVAELEEKLNGKHPPDVCQACGERQVRLSWSAPSSTKVLIHQAWSCKACGFVETRYVQPIKA